MKNELGVSKLKEIVRMIHGELIDGLHQVYYEALDELKDRLSRSKYNEFINSL